MDFKRNKFGVEAKVVSIEYDPNRTAFIALVQYTDGEKRYIIAPAGLKVDQTIVSGQENIAPEIGNAMPLSQNSTWYRNFLVLNCDPDKELT